MQNNIFAQIPQTLPEELFETLLQKPDVQIERIVSQGHTTPMDQWYDQSWDEWVLLLQGRATLAFVGRQLVDLLPGDYCFIPAHQQHRVSYTQAEPVTIWLAVHFR